MDDLTTHLGEEEDCESGLILPRRIVSPLGLLALASLVAAFTVLAWPDQRDDTFVRVVGVGAIVVAVATALGGRSHRRWWLLPSITMALVGIGLAVGGDAGIASTGRVLGSLAVLVAVVDLVVAIVQRRSRSSSPVLRRAVVFAALGAATLTVPRPMVSLLVGIAALSILVAAVMVLGLSLDGRRRTAPSLSDVGGVVSTWLHDRPTAGRERAEIRQQLLFEGRDRQSRLVRFGTLMALASTIASMGVLGDSTGVVIGAMLVAPLMTPLMAISLSLVMGWPRRLARHALIAAGGIGIAVGVGAVVQLIGPVQVDTATNTQVVSRIAPAFLDLVTACAAGAAGAYAISRRDVADSLPGAAIAISLVPPLTVTGIALAAGDGNAAAGSFLLFSTNAVAILVVGGLTFILTGAAPLRHATETRHRTSTGLAAIATIALVVLAGLFANGGAAARNIFERSTIDNVVGEWLEPHPDHRFVRVDIDADHISVIIAGPTDDAPRASGLAPVLAESLERDVRVEVRLVVEEVEVADSSG